jgi:glutaredoxin
VRIAPTLAALNDLDVKMADIENAYLTAPITEKVWTVLSPEFGYDAGKYALIVRALYGLKSAGAAFRDHLDECMKHLGCNPCGADRDLWMKAETRPDGGVLYWAFILIYLDDIQCVHHEPGSPLTKLDEYLKMKEGSIQVPTFYLGAKLKNTVLPNGVVDWGMSSSNYVHSTVQNDQEYMAALHGEQKLLKKASGPFAGGYNPELDESPELDPIRANFYQSQIGILLWCVELVYIDIITEVSMMSSYL